jgi:hypothetical protein
MLLLRALLISYYAIGCITSVTAIAGCSRGSNVFNVWNYWNYWNKLSHVELWTWNFELPCPAL